MKRTIGAIVLMFCAFIANAQSEGIATELRPGLALVERKVKSNVFEVNLKLVTNEENAQTLDHLLLSKQGILSANTDWHKRLCRVEALTTITEEQLADLVRFAGFEITKTNQD